MAKKLNMASGQPDAIAYEGSLTAISSIITKVGNPLYDNVPPLWNHEQRSVVCSLSFLYSYAQEWCKSGGALFGRDKDEVAEIILNYVNGIRIAWSDLPPSREAYYWAPPLAALPTGSPPPDNVSQGIISHTRARRGDQSSWLKILYELFPSVYPQSGGKVPSAAQFSQILGRMKPAALIGPGWKDFVGSTQDETYVTELLRDMVLVGGRLQSEMTSLGLKYPNDLNNYVARRPDLRPLGIRNAGASGEALVGTTIDYHVPFNSRGTVWIRLHQSGSFKVLQKNHRHSGRGTDQNYALTNADFVPGGGKLSIELEAENPTGRSVTNPPVVVTT
ncbi:MAG TPA: hypothetical protein VGX00_05230 [Thermoplasmata archaeon]|nr:hypothetical protein [Thermoplasmata archaeon]